MVEILKIQASDPTLPPNINKGQFDIAQAICCLLAVHTFAAGACSWSFLFVSARAYKFAFNGWCRHVGNRFFRYCKI